jgi:tetratricopeptide (TPR) repeat protein
MPDIAEMSRRYHQLASERRAGVSMARLLDAAKLLLVARQPELRVEVLRQVCGVVLGGRDLKRDSWNDLVERTTALGFGEVVPDAAGGEFSTYRPYLEQCVTYLPSRQDLIKLASVLNKYGSPDGGDLFHLGMYFYERHDIEGMEASFGLAVARGNADVSPMAAYLLGLGQWVDSLNGKPNAQRAKAARANLGYAFQSGDRGAVRGSAMPYARLLLQEGDLQAAIGPLEKAAENLDHREQACLLLCRVLGPGLHRLDDAKDAMTNALSAAGKRRAGKVASSTSVSTDDWFIAAVGMNAEGARAEAAAGFEEAAGLGGDKAGVAAFHAGTLYYYLGDPERSKAMLIRAHSQNVPDAAERLKSFFGVDVGPT